MSPLQSGAPGEVPRRSAAGRRAAEDQLDPQTTNGDESAAPRGETSAEDAYGGGRSDGETSAEGAYGGGRSDGETSAEDTYGGGQSDENETFRGIVFLQTYRHNELK